MQPYAGKLYTALLLTVAQGHAVHERNHPDKIKPFYSVQLNGRRSSRFVLPECAKPVPIHCGVCPDIYMYNFFYTSGYRNRGSEAKRARDKLRTTAEVGDST